MEEDVVCGFEEDCEEDCVCVVLKCVQMGLKDDLYILMPKTEKMRTAEKS